MRTFSAGGLLLLAACSQGADGAASATDGEMIACAVGGAGSFARDCTVERARLEGSLVLTVRHPDGGFRRFVATEDGRGLAPADGAEPATVSLRDDGIEVAVGADRYRFPATIARHDGK